MPNYCRFDIKAKGPSKDLVALKNLFTTPSEYFKINVLLKLGDPHNADIDNMKNFISNAICAMWETHQDKNLSSEDVKKITSDIYNIIYENHKDFLENNKIFNTRISDFLNSITNETKIVKGYLDPPQNEHLFRILDMQTEFDENDEEIYMSGDCAWSVDNCMLSDNGYYNDLLKANIPPEVFKGTALDLWIKDHPGVTLEIISQEESECFSERYFFENGKFTESSVEDLIVLFFENEEEIDETLKNPETTPKIRTGLRKFKKQYEALTDTQKEETFPVFIDITHPSYLTMDEDFQHHGHYDPDFRI